MASNIPVCEVRKIDLIIIWSECTKFHQNLSMQFFYRYSISSFFQKKYMAATVAILNLKIWSEAKSDWYDLCNISAKFHTFTTFWTFVSQIDWTNLNIHINSIALRHLYLYRKNFKTNLFLFIIEIFKATNQLYKSNQTSNNSLDISIN